MTKESLIKDLLVLGNLYNTNEEIQNAVYERALSIFNLYESEVKNLDIHVVNQLLIAFFKWREGQQLTADTVIEIETFAKEYQSDL